MDRFSVLTHAAVVGREKITGSGENMSKWVNLNDLAGPSRDVTSIEDQVMMRILDMDTIVYVFHCGKCCTEQISERSAPCWCKKCNNLLRFYSRKDYIKNPDLWEMIHGTKRVW
jgi:hypothetical protein